MGTKKVIRREALEKRNSLSMEERYSFEQRIYDQVISRNEFKEAESVLIYVNYRTEAATRQILHYALQLNKKVYCPKVLSDTKMEFYRISCLHDLKKGYQGILEPDSKEPYSDTGKSVMILPMSAFDEKRNRLGYGKGYYDRFLKNKQEIYKIGLAFECQKWKKELPVDKNDVPLDLIITETNCYE